MQISEWFQVQEQLDGQEDQWPWWKELEEDERVRLGTNYLLGAVYGIIFFFALSQLIRLFGRELVPNEPRWTIQKTFHLTVATVFALRMLEFFCRQLIRKTEPISSGIHQIIHDIPGLLYLLTYAQLVIFWAQVYHQSQGYQLFPPTLRYFQVPLTVAIFCVQLGMSVAQIVIDSGMDEKSLVSAYLEVASTTFMATLSLLLCIAFLLYGLRLFCMLKRFPIESRGRRTKLQEVGWITGVCSCTFFIRAFVLYTEAFFQAEELQANYKIDSYKHPLFNLAFYMICEIIPTPIVLFRLRKPRHRRQAQQTVATNQGGWRVNNRDYQRIPDQPQ